MRLLIDGGGYVEATDAFLLANRAAALRHHDLADELSAYGAMAGDSSSLSGELARVLRQPADDRAHHQGHDQPQRRPDRTSLGAL